MKIEQSRRVSFLWILLIYMLAAAVGIVLYRALPYTFWLNLLLADIAATLVTFGFSVIFRNASVYDPYWSVAPIVILGGFAVGQVLTPLKLGILLVVCFWGIRLTANWAYTFLGLSHQDWRYTMLQEKTGGFYPIINLVGIHLVPTLVVYGCILPAVVVMRSDTVGSPLCGLTLALSLGATLLQGGADLQMHRFRRAKSGGFIRSGLWRYSRHPNYLGEILMWWGVGGTAVLALPEAWYLLMGALVNTLLFLCVSIPLAEGRQARKAGFAAYRKETRMLLPFRK